MTGVRIPINRLISVFESKLWSNIANKRYYSIVSKNIKKGNNTVELLFENTEKYQPILFDSSLNVISFFNLIGNEQNIDGDLYEQDVDLLFSVNLKMLYPDIISYRAEQEVHRDVVNLLNYDGLTNVTINEVRSGLGSWGDIYTGKIHNYNQHPFHVFAVALNIKYYNYC